MTAISKVEYARLEGQRARHAGCNARLGEHGLRVAPSIVRITCDDGSGGFGWAQISREQGEALLGTDVDAVRGEFGIANTFRHVEFPLLDLLAQRAGVPVYELIGGPRDGRPRVPAYDTSLYFDDLHLADDAEAAALMASEAADGMARGHRAFKIKVGRGAMHMDLAAGTRRDIAVIRSVREVAGPDAKVMVDANNGYNLSLTKQVLSETSDCELYWMEEAFHEDAAYYSDLKAWMAAEGIATKVADGEGDASLRLLDWARDGLIDVVQYDIHRPGFSAWLALGPRFAVWGVGAAPHCYGNPYGAYASCHIGPLLETFEMVEWDQATVPGLDASAYVVEDGWVTVPDLPGLGLKLDKGVYEQAVQDAGWMTS